MVIVRTATWACLASLVLIAGCGTSSAEPTSAPVPLRATPPWVRDACGGLPAPLRSSCPSALPAGPSAMTLTIIRATHRYPVNLLQVEAGGEYFGNQRRNRPPRYVGVVVASGQVRRALPELFPAAGARV